MDRLNPREEDKVQNLYESMTLNNEIENFVRDELSGKARKTTAKELWPFAKREITGVTQSKFNKVWKSLIKGGYLVGDGETYKWEI